jgi:hypothetical protein
MYLIRAVSVGLLFDIYQSIQEFYPFAHPTITVIPANAGIHTTIYVPHQGGFGGQMFDIG